MDSEKTFSFRFQQLKALRYIFILALTVPGAILLPYNTPPFILILVILIPFLLAIILTVKHIKAADVIVVTNTYLDSQYFGRIDFEDITSVSSPASINKPCIRLKLKSGKKVTWAPFPNNVHDTAVLQEFIIELSKVIEHTPFISSQTPEEKGLHTIPAIAPALKQEMETVKEKTLKPKAYAIPASVAMLFLLSLYHYIIPKMREHKNDAITNMFQDQLRLNARLKEETKALVWQQQKKKGPFFIFTNDSIAFLSYAPEIGQSGTSGLLGDLSENDSLQKLIQYPDSAVWNICVTSGKEVYRLQKGLLNADDSTDTYVYIAEIDSSVQVANPNYISGYPNDDVPDSIGLQLAFAVPLYKNRDLETNLKEGVIGYKMFLSLLKFHQSSCKLYLAARNGEGNMNQALFNTVVAILKKDFIKYGIDTARFDLRAF